MSSGSAGWLETVRLCAGALHEYPVYGRLCVNLQQFPAPCQLEETPSRTRLTQCAYIQHRQCWNVCPECRFIHLSELCPPSQLRLLHLLLYLDNFAKYTKCCSVVLRPAEGLHPKQCWTAVSPTPTFLVYYYNDQKCHPARTPILQNVHIFTCCA